MNVFLNKTGNTDYIHRAEPTFDFDKELEKATRQYDKLLKELVNK